MFVLPNFNLDVYIWRYANYPGSPDVSTVGNLAWGRRNSLGWAESGWGGVSPFSVPICLLLPAETDVRDYYWSGHQADVVEVPAASGRFYRVMFVDDLGKGFPNEHRGALLLKEAGLEWPTPYP